MKRMVMTAALVAAMMLPGSASALTMLGFFASDTETIAFPQTFGSGTGELTSTAPNESFGTDAAPTVGTLTATTNLIIEWDAAVTANNNADDPLALSFSVNDADASNATSIFVPSSGTVSVPRLVLFSGDVLRFFVTGTGSPALVTNLDITGATSEIPLPPAALLMLAGLGGLVLVRKRAA
ncbi:MAG: hypothetical protein AAF160_15135 [Pseudomonadota bacterium]